MKRVPGDSYPVGLFCLNCPSPAEVVEGRNPPAQSCSVHLPLVLDLAKTVEFEAQSIKLTSGRFMPGEPK
jgi:hypothetical protein